MYKVQSYDDYERRWITATKLVDGRKKVHCEFEKRQQARNYIRNHIGFADQWRILCPDGTREGYQ